MQATREAAAKEKRMADNLDEVCTIRIELRDTDPVIWREVEVPTSVTLKVLHDIVQVTMGWLDYHLWEFAVDDRVYGPAMQGDWGLAPRGDGAKTKLRDVLRPGSTTVDYIYDLGDGWEHTLTVGDIRPRDPGVPYPRYMAGEWECPPEDCGGIPGYYNLLDALAEPHHPDHAVAVERLDGRHQRDIDELPRQIAFARIARRRNATRRSNARKAA